MYYPDYWEAHEEEWAAAQEVEDFLLMEADIEAAGGHIWNLYE